MQKVVALGFVLLAAANWMAVSAQPSGVLLLKQERDGAAAQNLSAAELASLGDPFFNLVLKDHAGATSLTEIENLLQPDADNRQTFVVDESIADPRPGQSRRVVLAFTGLSGSEALDTNVMLSVQFSSSSFPDNQRFVEVWGWDNHRGRYNYYKLDRTGTPDLRMSWKFRGSSDNADLLSVADREGTCMACHVNGAPVMKELLFPWNNWHSTASPATYLTTAAASRWPAADDVRLQRLRGAEELETSILAAITQFNTRRLNQALAREDATGNIVVDASGRSRVKEGRRLLRHLFETTEYNIISARQKSGLHPAAGGQTGPGQPVNIPAALFLNVLIINRGGAANFAGLGIARAADFGKISLTAQEYSAGVKASGMKLGGTPGDADFAWLVPEPSHIDNDMIDRLLRRGVVSPQFVAAVLSMDLENPVFSDERASFLGFVPNEFEFSATAKSHPDDLTTRMIAAISASNPAAGSPAARLLATLKSADPVKVLADQVDAYFTRVSTALANAQTRQAEIDRLFSTLVQRRRAALGHERLGVLNETGDRLFPVP